MAFRIRPLHERLFKSNQSSEQQSNDQSFENTNGQENEESIFVVDEDTGEIHEEVTTTKSSSNNNTSSSSQQQRPPELVRKESARVFGLSMKNRTKVSFM
jgi:hypothetical protein